jgi:outer membrane lipopolysaccharide assembly protein LptE/RlpB
MYPGVLILVLVVGLSFFGCGYTIQGKTNLPFQAIAINKIVNKTFEPKLEDRMQGALVNELMVQGFVIDSSAGYKIHGAITQFELRTLSEKSGVATEYEVVIKGDFRLMDPSGKTRELRNRGVFIVSFSSSEQLQSVMALKELATERALKDLSSEIVASLMYQ